MDLYCRRSGILRRSLTLQRSLTLKYDFEFFVILSLGRWCHPDTFASLEATVPAPTKRMPTSDMFWVKVLGATHGFGLYNIIYICIINVLCGIDRDGSKDVQRANTCIYRYYGWVWGQEWPKSKDLQKIQKAYFSSKIWSWPIGSSDHLECSPQLQPKCVQQLFEIKQFARLQGIVWICSVLVWWSINCIWHVVLAAELWQLKGWFLFKVVLRPSFCWSRQHWPTWVCGHSTILLCSILEVSRWQVQLLLFLHLRANYWCDNP